MPIRVKVGEDTLVFPDGMSDADMAAAIESQYPASAPSGPKARTPAQQLALDRIKQSEGYDPKAPVGSEANPDTEAPGKKFAVGAYYVNEAGDIIANKGKSSFALGVKEGVERAQDNVATWGLEGLKKVVGAEAADAIDRFGNSLAGQPSTPEVVEKHAQHLDKRAQEGVRPSVIGQIVGNTAAALPVLAATRNPWLAGGASGALNTKDPTNPTAVAVDTGLGAAMGKGSDVAMRGLGAVVAPKMNMLVQKLLDEGIELTPGQMLGGLAHRAEDATRTIYGLGDLVIGAQNRGNDSVVRAAVQRTLAPLSIELPRDLPTGHAQVKFAQDTLSDTYDAVLAQVKPQLDSTFGQNLRQSAAARPTARVRVVHPEGTRPDLQPEHRGDHRRSVQEGGRVDRP